MKCHKCGSGYLIELCEDCDVVPRWIRCKDKMPKGLMSVLLYVKDKTSMAENFHYITVGHWDSLNKTFVSDGVADIKPCDSDHDDDFVIKKSHVKYWMHLPKIPDQNV